jgi:hypothetical protein
VKKIKSSENDYHWRFSKIPSANLGASGASSQVDRMVEAGLKVEASGEAKVRSVIIERSREDRPEMSPIGSTLQSADRLVQEHIAALRREARDLEATLKVYGAGIFIAKPKAVKAGSSNEYQEHLKALICDKSVSAITIHGVRFERDASSGFVQVSEDESMTEG